MIDGLKIINAIDELVKEKNLDRQLIISAIKEGIIKAYEKHIDSEAKITVFFDEQNGDLKVYRLWNIVSEIENPAFEITKQELGERLITNKDALLIEDVYQEPVDIENFSRLATTQVGQIFVQYLKEAEREILYQKYISKKGEILIGVVDNIESGRFFLKISENTFAVLLKKDAIPFERLNIGDKVKFYVEDVKKNTGQIIASRINSGFLEKLLEIEVPEIYEGVVEIKVISRIPGERSKVAVVCKDPTIDAIGACVGTKGQRIQSIMKELNGEKIDIIRWDEEPQKFIINALSPAKVISIMLNLEDKAANIIVPDEHYSLSIGKKGITAKLTAKLTDWKINIIPYTKAQEEMLEFEWNGNLNLENLQILQENHKLKKFQKSETFSKINDENITNFDSNATISNFEEKVIKETNLNEDLSEKSVMNDESFGDDLDDIDDFEDEDFEDDEDYFH